MIEIYRILWAPIIIAQGFKVYVSFVCHSMMVGAKGYQVPKGIGSAFCARRDMMNIGAKIETTNNASVIVSEPSLPLDILPPPTKPTTITRTSFGVAPSQAMFVTVVAIMQLTRIYTEFVSAIGTRCLDLIRTTSTRRQALPCAVAGIVTACYPYLRRPFIKRLSANWTGAAFFAAPIVAVVFAPVLVSIYKTVLLARVFLLRNDFPAPASAVNNLVNFIHGWSPFARSIIPC